MYTPILPATDILIVACPTSPLPVFYTEADRPDYVHKWVKAIFPAHLEGTTYHHTCIVSFGSELGEMFSQIAEAHAREIEQEAHELSSLECDYVQ